MNDIRILQAIDRLQFGGWDSSCLWLKCVSEAALKSTVFKMDFYLNGAHSFGRSEWIHYIISSERWIGCLLITNWNAKIENWVLNCEKKLSKRGERDLLFLTFCHGIMKESGWDLFVRFRYEIFTKYCRYYCLWLKLSRYLLCLALTALSDNYMANEGLRVTNI